MPTRRALLLGAGAAALAGGAASAVARRDPPLASSPPPPPSPPPEPLVPDLQAGPVLRDRFVSPARLGAGVAFAVLRPPGVSGPLPFAVALHGHGGSSAALLDGPLRLPVWLAAAHADGVAPFALVTVSGGNGFWHERPDGEDAGAMVADELLPRLTDARFGLATGRRFGLVGWSMGGYGALRLGGLLGADRVATVCASSPGLYLDPDEAHPDGFADSGEYERFSVMDRQAELDGVAVRLDCGTEDYFYEPTRAYAAGFPSAAPPTTSWAPGGHEIAYTLDALPAVLAFAGERLAAG